MNNQIWQAVGAIIVGIIGAVIAVIGLIFAYYIVKKYVPILRKKTAKWLEKNRDDIRDKVHAWLHKNNLEESKLSDVYVIVDAVAGNVQKILYTVYAETKETGKVQVFEEEITIEEFQKINSTNAEKITKEVGQMSIMSQVM